MKGNEKIRELQLEINKLKKQLQVSNKQGNNNSSKNDRIPVEKNEFSGRFESIINNLQGVIYRCKNDKDWTMEFISDGIEALTGYPSSDFINNEVRSFNSVIHPDDREQLWQLWQEAIANKTFFANEYRVVGVTGEIRWVWERGCGVFEGGELVALEGFINDITANKLMQEDLRVKDELLHSIGDIAKVGGWEFSAETMEGSWTDEVARIHDLPTGTRIDVSTAIDYYVEKHRPILKEAINNALENGIPYDLELQLVSAIGVKKWVRTNCIPVYKNGKITGLKGTFQDITARKEALISLENERLRLKTIIETIPDLVWLKDPEGVYITCNRRFERFFGTPESEIRGKSDYDFMDKELADFFRGKDKEAIIANKPKINLEWITYADDGHREFLETIKTPMYDSMGNLIGVLGIARDITEIFQNKEKLKEKDLIFQSLLEKSPIYIFFKDHDIKALYLSKNYEEMLGMPLDQILGKDMTEIFPSDLAKSMIEDDKRILKEGKLVEIDEELNGRYYTTIKFPIQRDDGNPMLAGFTIDVTDREKAKQELMIAKEKAEESDKLKTAFLQNMSHEIRTPMNAIMGFSELLPDAFDNKDQLELYADIITQRSQDLLSLINGMLDIARIESGHVNIFREECDLKEWVEELKPIFEEYHQNIDKPFINLRYCFNFIDHTTVTFDLGKIKQVLLNLVSNAFKFTESGFIEIGGRLEEDQLQMYVLDSGIGIDEEYRGKIFDRFVQINPTKINIQRGAGLGLAIVKGLLESMGGTISLESEMGKGSKFTFTVPVVLD